MPVLLDGVAGGLPSDAQKMRLEAEAQKQEQLQQASHNDHNANTGIDAGAVTGTEIGTGGIPTSTPSGVLMPASAELPSPATLQKCASSIVFDAEGKEVSFGELVQGLRVVIVFVRHFFCGYCQEYIRALARAFPEKTLSSLSPPTKLVIIGCGDPSMIKDYIKETSCPYPIYADPKRNLYTALDFRVNLSRSTKPEYITTSFWSSTITGIAQGLKAGLGALKSGKINQNGGEMIMQEGKCVFFHRMKDTTGHLEMRDLEALLGIQK